MEFQGSIQMVQGSISLEGLYYFLAERLQHFKTLCNHNAGSTCHWEDFSHIHHKVVTNSNLLFCCAINRACYALCGFSPHKKIKIKIISIWTFLIKWLHIGLPRAILEKIDGLMEYRYWTQLSKVFFLFKIEVK